MNQSRARAVKQKYRNPLLPLILYASRLASSGQAREKSTRKAAPLDRKSLTRSWPLAAGWAGGFRIAGHLRLEPKVADNTTSCINKSDCLSVFTIHDGQRNKYMQWLYNHWHFDPPHIPSLDVGVLLHTHSRFAPVPPNNTLPHPETTDHHPYLVVPLDTSRILGQTRFTSLNNIHTDQLAFGLRKRRETQHITHPETHSESRRQITQNSSFCRVDVSVFLF